MIHLGGGDVRRGRRGWHRCSLGRVCHSRIRVFHVWMDSMSQVELPRPDDSFGEPRTLRLPGEVLGPMLCELIQLLSENFVACESFRFTLVIEGFDL